MSEPRVGVPRVVDWPEGPGAVLSLVPARASPVVVGICGRVGAGKSSLARALGGCVISTDDYLPDYETIAEHERDEPGRADLARLVADLASLRRGEPANVPVWSFLSHRREGEREVRGGPLIVVEGIFALHERLVAALDVRVFVDAPSDDRWRRWEHLERTGARGWGVERARAYFESVAEPTFARYEGAYRAAAHLIVRNLGAPAD
jgi:uridine kinase